LSKKSNPNGSTPTRSSRNADSERDDFEVVARRLECDEDKERFEEKLKKLAKGKSKSA